MQYLANHILLQGLQGEFVLNYEEYAVPLQQISNSKQIKLNLEANSISRSGSSGSLLGS